MSKEKFTHFFKFNHPNFSFFRLYVFTNLHYNLIDILAAADENAEIAEYLAQPKWEGDWAQLLNLGRIKNNGVPLQTQHGFPSFNLIFGNYLYGQEKYQKSADIGFALALNRLINESTLDKIPWDALEKLCKYHGAVGYVTYALVYLRLFNALLKDEDFNRAQLALNKTYEAFVETARLYESSQAAIHNAYLGQGLAAGSSLRISSIKEAQRLLQGLQQTLDTLRYPLDSSSAYRRSPHYAA